jgi:hypothetical protein
MPTIGPGIRLVEHAHTAGIHRRVWLRVQPSWREPLWKLEDVRLLVNPNLPALLFSCYSMPVSHC